MPSPSVRPEGKEITSCSAAGASAPLMAERRKQELEREGARCDLPVQPENRDERRAMDGGTAARRRHEERADDHDDHLYNAQMRAGELRSLARRPLPLCGGQPRERIEGKHGEQFEDPAGPERAASGTVRGEQKDYTRNTEYMRDLRKARGQVPQIPRPHERHRGPYHSDLTQRRPGGARKPAARASMLQPREGRSIDPAPLGRPGQESRAAAIERLANFLTPRTTCGRA